VVLVEIWGFVRGSCQNFGEYTMFVNLLGIKDIKHFL